MSTKLKLTASHFLTCGGAGDLLRCIEWEQTVMGVPKQCPLSRKVLIRIILDTPFPMYIAWGSDHLQFYNDAFHPLPGESKHPQATGISSRVTFAEIGATSGPLFQGIYKWLPGRMLL